MSEAGITSAASVTDEVTGTVLLDEVVPARSPWTCVLAAGDHLRIVDLRGNQAVDFLAYVAADPVEPDGALGIVDGISAPGKYVELRAELETLVVVSNCPQVNNPCNGFDPTPVRMVVSR